jgi:hypothetical protein
MRREFANPLQFLVSEVGFFLTPGTFHMAQSRFLRNAPEFSFRDAEKERSSSLRDVFWDLIVHDLSMWRDDGHVSLFDISRRPLASISVKRSVHLHEPPPA